MKKSKLIILLIFFIPFLLFARGEKEEEKITVTIWHPNTGINGEVFNTLVEEFNKTIGDERGIKIEAVYQGEASDVLTKVKASPPSLLPDIAQMDASACLEMKNFPYMVTLEEIGVDTSKILENAISELTSEIGILAMPFNCSSLLLYYNKTLFDSLSLFPPETLDEFASISKDLSLVDEKGKISRYAFSGVPTTYELVSFIGAQNGLSYIVDGKNGHFSNPTTTLFDKEGTFINFLNHWKAFYDEGFVDNISSSTAEEFAAGRTASILLSSSKLSTILRLVAGRFEVGTAFVPKVDEEATGGVNIGGGAMFSFSSDENVRIVLEFFSSADTQYKWALGTGYIPINTAVYENEEYISFLKENPVYSTSLKQILASNPALTSVWLPSAYQIYYSFQSAIRDVLESGKDVEEANNEMAQLIQRILDNYNGN